MGIVGLQGDLVDDHRQGVQHGGDAVKCVLDGLWLRVGVNG